MVITLALAVITCAAIYITVEYVRIYRVLKTYEEHKQNDYKLHRLKELMIKAIEVLKQYANTIAHPYFFNFKIDYILNICPRFVHVLHLCKYTLDYPESKKDLHNILIELYGVGFEDSPQLNVLVKVQSEFGYQEYFHYVVEDIEKATYLYVHNKAYVDKLILSK